MTVGREPATRHDAMQVRVKLQVLSPTVKHSEETDLRSQLLWISGDRCQGFSHGMEQNAVHDLLVLIDDRGDLFWDGKHNMKIGNVEKLGLSVLNPLRSCERLTFWTVSVAAAIEAISFVATLIATFEVTAQGGCAAHLDCGHDASLCGGHRCVMLVAIGHAVAAEHIRHFQLRAIHRAAAQKY